MASVTEMNLYKEYIKEIEERKGQGLHPKPIDSADLLNEIIVQIKDLHNSNRKDSLHFFIYNTLPGTTPAAGAARRQTRSLCSWCWMRAVWRSGVEVVVAAAAGAVSLWAHHAREIHYEAPVIE